MSDSSIVVLPHISGDVKKVLNDEALKFVAHLQRKFNSNRLRLLKERTTKQKQISREGLDFLPQTSSIRNSDWKVADVPHDLQKRWVEITGPVSPTKMVRQALHLLHSSILIEIFLGDQRFKLRCMLLYGGF